MSGFKVAGASPTTVCGNKTRKIVCAKQPSFVAEVIELSWKSGIDAARDKVKILAPHWKKGLAVIEDDKPEVQKYKTGSVRPGVYLVKPKKGVDTFSVKISITKSVGQDPQGQLTGSLGKLRFEGTCPTSVGEHLVTVKISNLPDTAEHYQGDAEWSVKTAQGVFPQREKTRLELFVIMDIPAAFFKDGAWVEALRFVFHKTKIAGSKDPVFIGGEISKYCHGAHGLRYDIKSGAAAFGGTKFGKSTFKLRDYMNWRTLGKGLINAYGDTIQNVVNCYDQAAALQALTGVLGIKAIWVLADPYGFIKTSNLVGVGPCNNPFYDPKKGPGAITATDHAGRMPFANHAFVQLFNKLGGILDSCAGPHTGKETIVQYIANTVDATRTMTDGHFVRGVAAYAGRTPATSAEYLTLLADEKVLYRGADILGVI
jgi:hypothetical protein